MNDLLTNILKNITTKPDAAQVTMDVQGDVEVYTITVDPEDVGRVIGKSGKVIRAIRSLAHVAAVQAQKKVRVHLDDGNDEMPQQAQTAVNDAAADVPAPETPVEAAPEPVVEPEAPAAPEEAEVPKTPEIPVEGEVPAPEAPQPEVVAPETTEEPVTGEAQPTPDTADLLPEEPAS
ncbi:KH domain-containing protein [Patescibacteria group bacterium]